MGEILTGDALLQLLAMPVFLSRWISLGYRSASFHSWRVVNLFLLTGLSNKLIWSQLRNEVKIKFLQKLVYIGTEPVTTLRKPVRFTEPLQWIYP